MISFVGLFYRYLQMELTHLKIQQVNERNKIQLNNNLNHFGVAQYRVTSFIRKILYTIILADINK